MVTCEEEGEASCSVESDDESDGATEGKWLGISIGLFFLLIFVAWLIRTLSNKQKRLQLISKFHHCCKVKTPEEGQAGYPSPNHVEYPSAHHETSAARSVPDRDPPTATRPSANGGVVYYKPAHLPAHVGTLARAGTSVPTELDHFGHYHTEKEHGRVDKDSPDQAHLAVPGRARPRHSRGMRKSRSSVSMASCNLAPIQEVEDSAADADGIQRVRGRVVEASRQGQFNSSPLGSRSHPDRLAYLALENEEEGEEEEDGGDDERGNMDSASSKIGPKGVVHGSAIGQRAVDVIVTSNNANNVSVNFEHGSDEEEESNG